MSDSRAQGFMDEVLGYVPPLAAEEVEWYRWLIGGLLVGSRRLLTQEQIARQEEADDEAVAPLPGSREGVLGARPSRAVLLALDEVSDLFDELIARIPVAAATRADVPEEVR